MKTLIAGFGLTGKAVLRTLSKVEPEVFVYDKNPEQDPVKENVTFYSDWTCFDLNSVSRVIASPGIDPLHPLFVEARKKGIPVIGEIELAAQTVKSGAIGITGTNGKTTVTSFLRHCFHNCGIKAHALGNIGEPLIAHDEREGVYIVELSSFQIDQITTKFLDYAVLLNLTPDHLERYKTMENYAKSKFRVQDLLKDNGEFFVQEKAAAMWPQLLRFKPVTLFDKHTHEDFSLCSDHDKENLFAIWQILNRFGVSHDQFLNSFKTFQKPHHRIEYVMTKEGREFYDDSKGTNLDSVVKAVLSMKGKVVLIAGGIDKGFPYSFWIDSFKDKVKAIFSIGESRHKIKKDLEGHILVHCEESLKDAVEKAFQASERGDSILLSPGCSSFDMFRDYTHRGEEFKRIVRGL